MPVYMMDKKIYENEKSEQQAASIQNVWNQIHIKVSTNKIKLGQTFKIL